MKVYVGQQFAILGSPGEDYVKCGKRTDIKRVQGCIPSPSTGDVTIDLKKQRTTDGGKQVRGSTLLSCGQEIFSGRAISVNKTSEAAT